MYYVLIKTNLFNLYLFIEYLLDLSICTSHVVAYRHIDVSHRYFVLLSRYK